MELNDEFIKKVKRDIVSCWNQIAPDALELGDLSNAEALEITIDADRLATAGYGDTQRVLREAFKEHGVGPVYKYLNRFIKLPM